MIKLHTIEPIELCIDQDGADLIITVDGYDYAYIGDVDTLDDVDIESVVDWVNNTYYDVEYNERHYIPNRLNKRQFNHNS